MPDEANLIYYNIRHILLLFQQSPHSVMFLLGFVGKSLLQLTRARNGMNFLVEQDRNTRTNSEETNYFWEKLLGPLKVLLETFVRSD